MELQLHPSNTPLQLGGAHPSILSVGDRYQELAYAIPGPPKLAFGFVKCLPNLLYRNKKEKILDNIDLTSFPALVIVTAVVFRCCLPHRDRGRSDTPRYHVAEHHDLVRHPLPV
jgi:hypothetical protein